MAQGISGVGLAVATGGALLVYAGFKGQNPIQALREVASGSPSPVEPGSYGRAVGKTLTDNLVVPGSTGSSSLVTAAKQYLGVPYVWGGASPKGMDCSGLVVLAFQDAYGVKAPRTTYQQEPWRALTKVSSPAAGDLVFWPGHVAIYVGDGNVIHAPRPGKTVRIVPMSQAGPVGVGVSSIRRYKGATAAPKSMAV